MEREGRIMFEITVNNLLREAEIKTLKLQSKDYDITFFYYGDYAKDMEKTVVAIWLIYLCIVKQ